jgi:hypothetical protein
MGAGRTMFTRLNEMLVRGTSAGARLHVGAQQRVGTLANVSGTLAVDTLNDGRIEARGANAFLTLSTPFIRNAGVLGAYDGGVLTLRDAGAVALLVDNTAGLIEAGAGGRVVLSDGHPSTAQFTTLRGGTLGGSGRFDVARLVFLDGATGGALTIADGATVRAGSQAGLYVAGRIVNHGTIDLRDDTNFLSGAGTLWVVGDITVDGSGQVQFSARDEMRIAGTDGNALLRVGGEQAIVAQANTNGLVRVDLANDGVIEARGANAFLTLDTDSVVNRGRIGAEEGGTLRVGAPLGRTVIDNRSGELHAGAGGRLILQGATHPSHTATTVIRGGEINGTGTVFMNGRVTLTDGVVLSPGNSPGVLTVDGNLALDPLGALEIELFGATLGTEYDQLLVRGQLSLAGTLDLLLPSAFRPTSTDVFTVLSATQLVGAFDNVRNGRIEFRYGSFDVLADRTSFRLVNFVAAVDPVGVPAPPVLPLLLGGVLLALTARRKGHTWGPGRRRQTIPGAGC